MKLYLEGHDCRYACEQSLLVLFPEERPEYSDSFAADNAVRLRLSETEQWVTASVTLRREGTWHGSARVRRELLTDETTSDRLKQRILRLAFFRAARPILDRPMPWGALTGVRPGKLAERLMSEGRTTAQTARTLERDFYVTPKRAEICVRAAEISREAKMTLRKEDVCLYVGIPFCPTRCAYCSFVSSSVGSSAKLLEPYLEALFTELEATASLVRSLGLRVAALYVGGGTPTTLNAGQLTRLFGVLTEHFDLTALREFTVEAGRPDTVTAEKLRVLRSFGCDRVSINPQTTDDRVLEAIGRRHTVEEFRAAYALAREAGFASVNTDLIAGLPGDSPAGFRASLEEMLALRAENVTVHTLSLKKGTRITLDRTPIPDGNAVGEMLDFALERLSGAGYEPYYLYRQKFISGGFENVGWTVPGKESLYNICIMEELCTVLGCGGGASTKLVNPRTGYVERVTDRKYPKEFIETLPVALRQREAIREFYEREIF